MASGHYSPLQVETASHVATMKYIHMYAMLLYLGLLFDTLFKLKYKMSKRNNLFIIHILEERGS